MNGPGTLRLSADNFPVQCLASSLMQPRLNKRPSWQSFCSSITGKPSRQRKFDFMPTLPLGPSKLHSDHLYRKLLPLRSRPTRCCSRISQKTPRVRRSRWADGFVPSPLSAGDASFQAACRRCLSSSSLSYLAGSIRGGASSKWVGGQNEKIKTYEYNFVVFDIRNTSLVRSRYTVNTRI